MHKNCFLGVLNIKESKSAVKSEEKQNFHGENRNLKVSKFFSFEF